MKIVAVACKPSDLKPGDLFSSVGPDFWDGAHLGQGIPSGPGAIGVKVYIRTEVPFDPGQDGSDQPIYRLHIIPTVIEQEEVPHAEDLEPE